LDGSRSGFLAGRPLAEKEEEASWREKKKMEAIQYVGLRKSCTLCTQQHVACNG
jgi:hypothetical protein